MRECMAGEVCVWECGLSGRVEYVGAIEVCG